MNRLGLALISLLLAAFGAPAQTLDNGSLVGAYGFVHLLSTTTQQGSAVTAETIGGTMLFDGVGGYSYQGQGGAGSAPAAARNGTGVYSLAQNGFLTLTNPINPDLTINARYGLDAMALLGASTESADGRRDIFVAVKLPEGPVDDSLLNGVYRGASVLFPDGLDQSVKTAFSTLSADGAGTFPSILVDGHAADQNDFPLFEGIGAATFAINADGTGTAALGAESSLLFGDRELFVSADGSYLLGFSSAAGARDILIAVRGLSDPASDASFNGPFWIVDFIYASGGGGGVYTSAVGAVRGNALGNAVLAERSQDFFPPLSPRNQTLILAYGVSSDGSGYLDAFAEPDRTNFALGAPAAAAALRSGPEQGAAIPNAFVAAEVHQQFIHSLHGVSFGIRVPNFSGEGVFVSPLGVVNAASFAPTTAPIAPGTLVSIFGSNLAASTAQAADVPLPTTLAGVSVSINGIPAPLFFVSPEQINVQTPFGVSGAEAVVRVNNEGELSNEASVPLAKTSPAIFSVDLSGFGPGTFTHADFSPITEQDPALLGETIIVFLTGLGEVAPAYPDGAPGPTDPLSLVTDPNLQVLFGSEAGEIQFAGAAPDFVGLYQINVTTPLTGFTGAAVPVSIATSDSFSDMTDIALTF